jgi:glycosyltransferase involved in cell wall biosynthesis
VRADIVRVGVVVPVHNEESLLTVCLASLKAAAQAVPLPVRILVVLDDCTDSSGEACRRAGVETRKIGARNVGAARAEGVRVLLGDEASPESVWLASTDADSRVRPMWLRDQLAMAGAGADVVVGVVQVDETVSPELRRSFEASYQSGLTGSDSHLHVHGANLGVRASVYLRAGGFPQLHNHEDRRLVQTLSGMPGVVIERSRRLIVSTSGRLDGRCDEGFAADLAALHRVPAPIGGG